MPERVNLHFVFWLAIAIIAALAGFDVVKVDDPSNLIYALIAAGAVTELIGA